MLLNERKERELAEEKLARAYKVEDAEAVIKLMDEARRQLEQALKLNKVPKSEEIIQNLAKSSQATAQVTRLQQEILDLNRKLVLLESLRVKLEQAGRQQAKNILRADIEEALKIQDQIRKLARDSTPPDSKEPDETLTGLNPREIQELINRAISTSVELKDQVKEKLGIDLRPGGESKVVRDVVDGARIADRMSAEGKSIASTVAENEKLKIQVGFYEKRDKLRGLDHPPCWMDNESRIEYIFSVHTTSDGFLVSRGWATHRENDAKRNAGFEVLMANPGLHLDANRFSRGAVHYLDEGKASKPECRHFVYLSSTIPNADRRDEARRLVNSFFYVLERRSSVKQ